MIDNAVKATCENNGLTEGQHCSVCNYISVKQNEISPLGHKYDKTKNRCTRCNAKEYEQEINSNNDFNLTFDTTKPIVIFMSKLSFTTNSNQWNNLTLSKDVSHYILIGDVGKVYNCRIVWNPQSESILEFVNVVIKTNTYSKEPMVSITTNKNVIIRFLGTTNAIYQQKAGLKSSSSLSGGDGANGQSAISVSNAALRIEMGSSSNTYIYGGDGGNGQKGTYPGADGGNGGNGGVGVSAKSITVSIINSSSKSLLSIKGGNGGSGASGGLFGSSGSNGSSGNNGSVTIIYE